MAAKRILRAVRHRALGQSGAESGMTLMELVVSMGLATLLGAMTLAFFISSNTAASRTVTANISSASARDALDSWTQLIRVADTPAYDPTHVVLNSVAQDVDARQGDSIVYLDATNLVFYANVGNRGSTTGSRASSTKMWLALENGSLIERSYPDTPANAGGYDASGAPAVGGATTTRVLATNVTLGAQAGCGTSQSTINQLFIPCSAAGAQLAMSASDAGSPGLSVMKTACNDADTSTYWCGSGNPTVPTTVPASSIVIAFTVTTTTSDGVATNQSYISAAAMTGAASVPGGNS
ncbi:type II secretory pathway component PulJ [Jatrophihabitans sp. GAS493]|nr:type II secretory pathway component PulJ [Jatrophihabitans sp. GAS493]